MATMITRNALRLAGAAAAAAGGAAAVASVFDDHLPTAQCDGGSTPIHLARWIDGWAKGRTGFHKTEVNPALVKYADKILPAEAVLVPLCGKTVDMEWLAEQDGVSVVVGTEAVRQAIVELQDQPGKVLGFQEIPEGESVRRPKFKSWAGAVIKPQGSGGGKGSAHGTAVARVIVLEGDHLALDPVDLPAFGHADVHGVRAARVPAVWDRASLVAVRPEDRTRYVEVYERVVPPKGKILLSVLDYDQASADGPPWSVPETTVRELFPASKWAVELLHKVPAVMSNVSKFTGVNVSETVYLVTRK